MRNLIKFLVPIVLTASFAQAQPPDDASRPQNMDAVRIWKLVEVLELTEEQSLLFLPIVQIHERELREAQKEANQLNMEGQNLLKKGDVSQEDVDKMIQKYADRQKKMHEIKHDFITSLPKYLTPKQQLLYLGFEARFRKDLRQFMKERQGKPGHKFKD